MDSLFVVLGIYGFVWAWIALAPPLVIYVDRVPLAPPGAWGAAGMGFIFIRRRIPGEETVLRHEFWHFRQMSWVSPLVFGLLYFGELLFRWGLVRDLRKAYEQISWERQARTKMFEKRPLRFHWKIGRS